MRHDFNWKSVYLAAGLLAASFPSAASLVTYSVIDLPANYVPKAINASGQTVACPAIGTNCYFLNKLGGQWYNIPGVWYDSGNGGIGSINSSAELTGSDANNAARGGFWTNPTGNPVAIPDNDPGGGNVIGAYVNDEGHLFIFDSNSSFYYSTGLGVASTKIPNLNWPSYLNNRDTVAGMGGVYANNNWTYGLGLWNPTTALILVETTVRPGKTNSINDSNQVAFQDGSQSSSYAGIPYFWNGSSLQSMAMPGGCTSATIQGLSNSGEVFAICQNGLEFAWQNGMTALLNDLVPSGTSVLNIYAVSNSGILGAGIRENGQIEYALLVPSNFTATPEPSTCGLLIAGAALVLSRRVLRETNSASMPPLQYNISSLGERRCLVLLLTERGHRVYRRGAAGGNGTRGERHCREQ